MAENPDKAFQVTVPFNIGAFGKAPKNWRTPGRCAQAGRAVLCPPVFADGRHCQSTLSAESMQKTFNAKAQRGRAATKSSWTAATGRRFSTTRHVASNQSADMSAHSKNPRRTRRYYEIALQRREDAKESNKNVFIDWPPGFGRVSLPATPTRFFGSGSLRLCAFALKSDGIIPVQIHPGGAHGDTRPANSTTQSQSTRTHDDPS